MLGLASGGKGNAGGAGPGRRDVPSGGRRRAGGPPQGASPASTRRSPRRADALGIGLMPPSQQPPPTDLELLLTAYRLKDAERMGWVLRGISRPESVADHSWGTALLCLLFAGREGVDPDRAVRIALVHDLAESITGDVASRADTRAQAVSREEKARREGQAMDRLAAALARGVPDAPDVRALWQEYEDTATQAARFVRDMNLVDMVLQAVIYEEGRRYDPARNREAFPDFDRLDEFFATSAPRLGTRTGRALFEVVRGAYERVRGAG